MNKKALLASSGVLACLTVAMGIFEPFRLCGDQWRNCMDMNYRTGMVVLPAIPLFLLSLITYKMRESVYRAWLRFACWWIPLSMIAIYLAPEYTTNWMYPVVKGTVAFWSSVLFIIISLLIIGYTYLPKAEKFK